MEYDKHGDPIFRINDQHEVKLKNLLILDTAHAERTNIVVASLSGFSTSITLLQAQIIDAIQTTWPNSTTPKVLSWLERTYDEQLKLRTFRDECWDINRELKPGFIHQPKYTTGVIYINSWGCPWTCYLDNTYTQWTDTLEDNTKKEGYSAYEGVPLTPIEAATFLTTTLYRNKRKSPNIEIAIPNDLIEAFEGVEVRNVGGIPNDELERLRFQAYAKVATYPGVPAIPMNDKLVALRDFVLNMEEQFTRPAMVEMLRPSAKIDYKPVFLSLA